MRLLLSLLLSVGLGDAVVGRVALDVGEVGVLGLLLGLGLNEIAIV